MCVWYALSIFVVRRSSLLVVCTPALSFYQALPLAMLNTAWWSGALTGDGPFPRRSSALQRVGARLMQELKRVRATDDAIAMMASHLFGGLANQW